MSISMIGLDHNRASVDIRALFAFTKKNAGEALEKLKECPGIDGCILLSTCNRLELWVSSREADEPSLYEMLCQLKDIRESAYEKLFVKRQGEEAARHLFYLTAGLKSQILGEDQILTQVKDALNLAREHFATDSVLEVLFRMAVTAGKRIKTEVSFSHGNPSVIHQALRHLNSRGYTVDQKTCMVIGNGEMGKVAAQTLQEAGGDVTVTVRQYRSGVVQIPKGCRRIDYSQRMDYLPACDLVVSATSSPNFTLRRELFEGFAPKKPLLLIDLAVPRDIEPELGELPGITLYDMDSFKSEGLSAENEKGMQEAGVIVQEQLQEFYQWLDGRDIIPRIGEIRQEAVNDFNLRINKILKNTPMMEKDRERLLAAVDAAAGNVFSKLIFGLRDSLNDQAFRECVAGLEKVYEE